MASFDNNNGTATSSSGSLRRRITENDERDCKSPTCVSLPGDNKEEFRNTTKEDRPTTTTTTNIIIHEKTLLEKLVSSKEETNHLHVHKILGISCLVSFIYRFCHLGRADGNFGRTWGTLGFVALHLSLNASAFIFAIPERRIRDGGFRIWPEYRIHSLVFTSRSLAFILLLWYEQTMTFAYRYERPSVQYYFMDLVVVLATCVAADLGSFVFQDKKHHSNTVRGATFTDPFEQYFASEMQLFLTAYCLVGYRRYTLHLVAVFVIQITSFLLTMRRKNVAPQSVLTACYTLLLVGGFCAMIVDTYQSYSTLVGATFGSVAAILRLGPLHVNKYVLWLGLGLVVHYLRFYTSVRFHNTPFWLYAFCITKLISSLVGVYQRSKAPKEQKSSMVGWLVFVTHGALYGYLFLANLRFFWP